MKITITHIDTACILLDIGGYRILTDPTLDEAGGIYHHGFGAISRKTGNPGISATDLHDIDLILLSHHQHKDNFDHTGRAFSSTVTNIISTVAASRALKGVIGLKNWQTHIIPNSVLPNLHITATPAQHRPSWIPEFVSGPVIGFVIEFDGQNNGVIYLSGDTVYFKGIDEIASRYKIDIAVLNVGSVQFRYLTGLGKYTMDASDLVKAAKILKPARIFPVHTSGWTHFKENENTLGETIKRDVFTRTRTTFLVPGQQIVITRK